MRSVCAHRSTYTNTQTNVHLQKLFKVLPIKPMKKKRIKKHPCILTPRQTSGARAISTELELYCIL